MPVSGSKFTFSLSIPVLNRMDLLASCLRSIDTPIDFVHIIDNSDEGSVLPAVGDLLDRHPNIRDFWVTVPARNMGVAASWNFAIKQRPLDAFWLIANADTEFGAGDIARLRDTMHDASDAGAAAWIGMCGDWRVFGINAPCIDKVGWFDENFHPIYCEDADYEWRCRLAGVPYLFLDGTSKHVGSASYRSEQRYAKANASTYPRNVEYYLEKWGGMPRAGEHHRSPFAAGHPVGFWQLRTARLASLRWD